MRDRLKVRSGNLCGLGSYHLGFSAERLGKWPGVESDK